MPRSLSIELAWLIVFKIAALVVLYLLFFSPAHRPMIDPVAHIAGSLSVPSTNG